MEQFAGSWTTAAVIAAFGFVFSIYTYLKNRNDRKIDLTLTIWRAWISKDYRAYRVTAARAIEAEKKLSNSQNRNALMSEIIKERESEEAVGSIEHFLHEISQLKSSNMLNEDLFKTLFGVSVDGWETLLSGINYDVDGYHPELMKSVFQILKSESNFDLA